MPEVFYSEAMPSIAGHPFLEAGVLFSLILLSCLASEWLWRTAWSLKEQSGSIKDPATALRWAFFFLLVSVLLRVLPDTVQAMTWREAEPQTRFLIAMWDKRLDFISVAPFLVAWAIAYLGGPMLLYQLRREPLPLHLWPTRRQVSRPAKIACACLALALALTYLR